MQFYLFFVEVVHAEDGGGALEQLVQLIAVLDEETHFLPLHGDWMSQGLETRGLDEVEVHV